MDLQPDAVAERVNIALVDRVLAADRLVAARLEVPADLVLVRLGRRARLQLGDDVIEGAEDLLVGVLKLRRRVADREGAGHVVAVAAADLAREDVEDDRSAELERLVVVAGGVRQAGVAALGEDDPVGRFEPLRGQLTADQLPDPADRDRRAAGIHQRVAAGAPAADEVDHRLDDGAGLPAHPAHDLDLLGLLREPRRRDDILLELGDDLQAGDLLGQRRQQGEMLARAHRPVDPDPAADAQVGEHAPPILDHRPEAVGHLLLDLAQVPAILRDQRQAGLLGLDLLPRAMYQHRRLAALLDHRAGDMPPADEIVVIRVGAAEPIRPLDDDRVDVALGHQSIQVAFQRNLLTLLAGT